MTSGHIVFQAIPNPRKIQDLVRCLAEGRGNPEDYALLGYGASVRMLN